MAETAQSIVKELERFSSPGVRKVFQNHCGEVPVLGVKIADLKKIQKRVKIDYRLALDLFETGTYEAMYLAGLIADDSQMTKKDLQKWMNGAGCPPIADYTVAWVTAGSAHGWDLALKWIDSKKEGEAAGGWSTLGCLVALTDDSEIDVKLMKKLLQRVRKTIHDERNRVRYSMNTFLISVGSYVAELTADVRAAAKEIGTVTVDMGGTACKVPDATGYIKKVEARGAIGKKRKSVKC